MKIAIIGGGVQGLTAAWILHKKHEVTLFEKKERLGGWIETIEKEGFFFERGPRGFRPHSATLQLCEEIGLKPIVANISSKKRYLLLDGKLKKITPWMLLKYTPEIIQETLAPGKNGDETIGAFFERRMGRKFTETFIDPLVTGILGGNLWELSLQANFPKLKEWEVEHGSLVKGYFAQKKRKGPPLLSFTGGMEKLIHTLKEKLEGHIQIALGQEASNLHRFDHVIVAHSSKDIPHVTLTTVNMGWQDAIVPLKAFGYLIPSKEREKILGVTFDSEIFPTNNSRLCVMLRGEHENSLEIARDALKRHLGIVRQPDIFDIHIAKDAVPQYLLGSPLTGNRVGVNEAVAHAYRTAKLNF